MNSNEVLNYIRRLTSGNLRGISYDISEELSRILWEHNCLYLLNKLKVITPYTEKLAGELQMNRLKAEEKYSQYQFIFDTLSKENIGYAVLKGVAFSSIAYGDSAFRRSGDLDLLIHPKDRSIVRQILLSQGYTQGRLRDNDLVPCSRQERIYYTAFSHQMAPFFKKLNGKYSPWLNIDINTNLFWGESNIQSNMDVVISQYESAIFAGVTFNKLKPIVEFIAVCLHHYKDMNSLFLLSDGSLNLRLFCDIYFYFLHQIELITPSKLLEQAEILEAIPYIYYCLYYTHYIFNDEKLLPFIDALTTEQGLNLISKCGLAKDEQKICTTPMEERLFALNRCEMFYSMLNDNDLKKIKFNEKIIF